MLIETRDGRTLGDFPRGSNGNNAMFETVMESGERVVAITYKYEEYTTLLSAYCSLKESIKLRNLPLTVVRKFGKIYFVRTDVKQ